MTAAGKSLKKVRIATRGSKLALWQAEHIRDLLAKEGINAELVILKTQGDREQELTFDKMEGKGFFTKEIEQALLDKNADLAVHSFKDLQTSQPDGLMISGVSYREDPADMLLIGKSGADPRMPFNLKQGALVGTSSIRRKTQFQALRPDVKIEPLRGNVPTRVERLKLEKYDAIILAAAGLERLQLDLSAFHMERLDPRIFVPAPAQGVIAFQTRSRDRNLKEVIGRISNRVVAEEVMVEREVLRLFEGGCQVPIGVFCEKDSDENGFDFFKVSAAISVTNEQPPVLLYHNSYNPDELPALIVSKVREMTPGRVFITRNIRERDYFYRVLTGNGFEVKGKALIEMRQVAAKAPKRRVDWVFFSSKHAVRFFFRQDFDLPGVKYGVVGKGTADELRKFGKKASFIGYSADVAMTGKQFEAVAGSDTILFPQALNSLRTVQKQMKKPDQVIDMVVYETLQTGTGEIPDADILVFTSPSNVEAFFEISQVNDEQKVIAMGEATGRALRKRKVKYFRQPASFDDTGLVQAVFGYSS